MTSRSSIAISMGPEPDRTSVTDPEHPDHLHHFRDRRTASSCAIMSGGFISAAILNREIHILIRVFGALFFRGVGFQQGLPVGHGDLVIIGVDFAEGQKPVPVAAIIHEGGLKRRFDPGNLGEIDITD